MMSIADRVKVLLSQSNTSQRKFAKMLNISPPRLNNYVSGIREFPHEIIQKIVELTNCDYRWLLTGEGEMFQTTRVYPDRTPTLIKIDIIPDIAAGDGYDCTMSEPLFTLSYPADLLPRPGPYFGFRVTGDSMEPDIKADDVVILCGNWEGLSLDGLICGFRNSDGMILKRLVLDHKKREGWLFSINQSYKPIRYDKNTPDLTLIGVLCVMLRNYLLEEK